MYEPRLKNILERTLPLKCLTAELRSPVYRATVSMKTIFKTVQRFDYKTILEMLFHWCLQEYSYFLHLTFGHLTLFEF